MITDIKSHKGIKNPEKIEIINVPFVEFEGRYYQCEMFSGLIPEIIERINKSRKVFQLKNSTRLIIIE